MNKDLVSVILPTYNSSKHVREAIDSIINQTYNNWELIVIDGYSTDGTIDIVKDYLKIDNRISLLFDEGGGLGAALKLACRYAKGTFIARLDADDVSLPERLQKETDYLKQHSNVVVVSCSAEFISEDGEFLGYFFPLTWKFQLLQEKRNNVIHSGVMMRRDVYEKCGGYSSVKSSEDFLLWCRMRRYGEIHVFEYPYVKYRFSVGALSNTTPSDVGLIFKPYVNKKELTDEDVNCINEEISKKRIGGGISPSRYVSPYENIMFNFLHSFISKKISFKIVFFIKNLYGLVKYHSVNL